ncbi:MAG TPA: S8 family serine peptidase [Vicinamibacteria bacterium]|nr:S8 family serine peptidase [Vicinamibacteria bacterium]
MNRFPRVFAAVATLLVLSTLLDLHADEPLRVASVKTRSGGPDYAPDQVIVGFRADADDSDVARVSRMAGAARVRKSAFGRRVLLTLDAGFTVAEALDRLRGLPEVEYAEPNHVYRAYQARRFAPNDRFYQFQWHLQMLDSERVWGIQTGDPAVGVAVLDTGIAYEDFGPYRKAPDFGNTTFLAGFDFINNDSHANDDNFHGTHVASVIAEATDNTEGVASLAFRVALMPVKVLDAEGFGNTFVIAEGIDFAAANSTVKVINMSLGGSGSSTSIANAVTRAVGRGITVVAASGNDGEGTVGFPANLSNVIAVGAIEGRKRRAPYSNFGSALDLVAPGGDLDRDDTGPNLRPDGRPDGILQQTFDPEDAARGIFNDFGYFFVVGTSQATPHVSALAALLYRQGITDPVAIQRAMEMTADDLGNTGRDDQYGHGLINPTKALSGFGLNQQ